MPDMTAKKIKSQYIMFKGDPGTLKSTQALTYPKPQYWFSWDRKMESMILPMQKYGIDPKLIEYDDYRDWAGPRAKLESFLYGDKASFNPAPLKFKTIVFDSITSMADSTLNQTKELKRGTTKSSGGEAGKRVAGIVVNEIEDYNAEASALSELISLSKDLREKYEVNIILIAHVIQAEFKSSPNSPSTFSRTIVTAGKRIAPKIPAYCGEVYHFNIKKDFTGGGGQYEVITNHTGDDFARTGLPLDLILPVGYSNLYDGWIKPAIDKLNSTLP